VGGAGSTAGTAAACEHWGREGSAAGTALATSARVRLTFDRGTLLIEEPEPGLALGELPEVRWDPRVGKHRAPACHAYRIASELRRRGIALGETPCPRLAPPSGVRPVELRPYQEAALAAWRLSDAQLELTGVHPEFGEVTLRQLLATWVAHDLGHIAQIARVMAKQYREAIGPWHAYLPIVTR